MKNHLFGKKIYFAPLYVNWHPGYCNVVFSLLGFCEKNKQLEIPENSKCMFYKVFASLIFNVFLRNYNTSVNYNLPYLLYLYGVDNLRL